MRVLRTERRMRSFRRTTSDPRRLSSAVLPSTIGGWEKVVRETSDVLEGSDVLRELRANMRGHPPQRCDDRALRGRTLTRAQTIRFNIWMYDVPTLEMDRRESGNPRSSNRFRAWTRRMAESDGYQESHIQERDGSALPHPGCRQVPHRMRPCIQSLLL